MRNRLIICGIVFGLAFWIWAIFAIIARANPEQTRPEQLTLASHSPLYAHTDIPPCWHRTDSPMHVVWLLRAKDGTVIIVGAEDVRKRC